MAKQLITDEQALLEEVPDDWTWIQTDFTGYGRTQAYRTRDGFYYIRKDNSSGDITHGVASQERTTTYVPMVEE